MPAGPADKGAYARSLCAVVEHWSDGEETRRARVGTAQLTMGPRPCDYVCELWDDLTGTRKSVQFRHAPEVLQHWDLLVRAVCWADHNQPALPARPPLRLPPVFEEGGKECISLGKLCVQAHGGFRNWLARQGIEPRFPGGTGSGIVPAQLFADFVERAL
ncbi:hypothetical protein DES44_1199 [Roseateles depolymerans]|uniref:Uncharacterized protein n=2 Tax=Roseateles depolymerans TaxID=76731 RepID=A0A0U3LRR6_9BURK|nr:hypothetical protein RD2015_3261 [Roseateles depolymerans]REG22057.1 hypothetical protein DES44_1199 [Roseateles depolymerans]